jgi:hypothetical protein
MKNTVTYQITFEYSNGKQITLIHDTKLDLGSVCRVPGTDTYAEVISIGQMVNGKMVH